MLVYDITQEKSFEECKNYYKKEIIDNCKENIKVILVGNKTDKESERKITKEQGANFAEESGYYFRETSCEYNTNVADVFETIILMTNNDMINSGKENLEEKKKLELFDQEEGAEELKKECEKNGGENNDKERVDLDSIDVNLKDVAKKVIKSNTLKKEKKKNKKIKKKKKDDNCC